MDQFSVGDRVKLVDLEGIDIINGYKEGELHTIEGIGEEPIGEGIYIEKSKGAHNGFFTFDQVKLISKGGQNEMENLEAIAVVGDEDLKEKLAEVAVDNGWSKYDEESPTDDITYYYKNGWYEDSTEIIGTDEQHGYFSAVTISEPSKENREVLELPQDWEKAKKFVTQDFEKSFELAGEEVEVDGKEFSIGCYTGHLDDLQDLVDGLHGLGVNNVEITERQSTVNYEDLKELREFVEGKQ